MGTVELKNKLIEIINTSDERFLRMVNALQKSYYGENTTDSLVSDEHYKIVEERRKKWLAGETKGLSWDEVKLQLKQKYGF